MKCLFALILPLQLFAQSARDSLDLDSLVQEALRNNPELKAFEYNREMMETRAEGSGQLEDPQLTFMRDEMPGFRWNDARFQRIEVMQMVPFPGKLSAESEIAEIQAEHAHHEHMEKANEMLARLRTTYYELWFIQQSIALNRENGKLLSQLSKTAQTRYGVGLTPQQDVLKSFVEIAKTDNQLIMLRQQEQSAKAMLSALLNRSSSDSLGIAVVPPAAGSLLPLDSLVRLAMKFRGMLMHDSLSVEESRQMLSLAHKELLPNFTLGATFITMPGTAMKSWGVTAGVNLPFAPWSLRRNNASIEQATTAIDKARATLRNSQNMIRSNISDLFFRAHSLSAQLRNYTQVIVPQSQQALRASMMAYQTGKTDFLMLMDSYRMLVDLSMEKLMLRMQFEHVVAQMKREVGYAGIIATPIERN